MPKPHKVESVRKLTVSFESSDAALLAEYKGLKVGEMLELRRALAANGAKFGVVKNTLGRIAATNAGMDDLVPLLSGSTAIAFVQGDAVLAAKGLEEAAKKYPALVVKGGILGKKVLTAEQARALAKVQSREVLLAQLAGLLISPIQKVASLIYAPLGNLGNALYAFQQLRQSQDGVPAAPTESAAVDAAIENQEAGK
ncbi:MAG: 50S ribosomal protein L10 [Actinomycetota bacterium]